MDKNSLLKQIPEETAELQIERLKIRIFELEDSNQRIEANAADTIGMIENLAVARAEAERALKQAQEHQETIQKLALFDPLTGVANRNLFQRSFDEGINAAKRDGTMIALLLFDLDHFKNVNDTFGHPVGDGLLKHVAKMLIDATRETDTVARLGGDEFAIILTHLDREDRVTQVAERIIKALGEPIVLDGSLIKTGTSIGVSVYPRDGEDTGELLRKGDAALYSVKEQSRGGYKFFDEEINKQAKAAHVLENDMRLAVVRNEFVLHYQPQLNAKGGEVSGVEALVRWQHPSRGLLSPFEFIGAAEANGLIVEVGNWILNKACQQRKAWEQEGLKEFRVAVNVSPIQFQNSNFLTSVNQALAVSGLSPSLLELEITESAMVDNIEQVSETIRCLSDLGIDVSVDDFGTGHSSLAYLKRLPIQKLKIDKSFVDNLHIDADDLAIANAVVSLGHTLGLTVIAEGVESIDQAKELHEKGCDEFQGYLFSKPILAETFADFYRANRDKSQRPPSPH